MSKGTLEFDLNDHNERAAHKRAVKSTNVYLALHEISESIFRPARKHGYGGNLQAVLDKCGSYKDEHGCEVGYGEEIISQLEDMFYQILIDNDVSLGDLE